MDKFIRVRRLFPVTKKLIYFNHAAVSPISTRAQKALERFSDEQMNFGGIIEDRWEQAAEEARVLAARLLGAKPGEIAFVSNTTHGLNLFARGIRWRKGDNVVLPRVEFPANVYPWLSLESKGVKVKFVEERDGRILVEDIERAIDARTRVVAISFVEFSSGYRNDLRAIGKLCRERGVYLVVDGIQGVGVLKIDVKKSMIDALSCGGHKWLLAPQGTGIFYCSSRVMQEIEHPMPGWMSVVGWQNYYEFKYELFTDSRRYESAQKNLMGITGLLESLKLIHELGIEDVERRIIELTDYLCDLLKGKHLRVFSPRGKGEKSGIVSFYPHADAVRLREKLLRLGIVTSARQGRIRVSPHFYNTYGEIERFVKTLSKL